MATRGHNNKVCSIKALDDYVSFVSTGWDKNMMIWDLRKPEAIDQFLSVKVAGDATDLKGGNLLVG